MPTQSGATAKKTAAKKTAKRTPAKRAAAPSKSAAEIRAGIEAQVRAEVEASIRAEVEAEYATQTHGDDTAASPEAADYVRTATEKNPRPVTGLDLTGDPSANGALTVHFIEDGFTALGKVWYRGEELTIVPGTKEYDEAPRRFGKVFAEMDEFEQEEVWGRRIFRSGPWRGKRLTEIEDPDMTENERAALERAEQKRASLYG